MFFSLNLQKTFPDERMEVLLFTILLLGSSGRVFTQGVSNTFEDLVCQQCASRYEESGSNGMASKVGKAGPPGPRGPQGLMNVTAIKETVAMTINAGEKSCSDVVH